MDKNKFTNSLRRAGDYPEMLWILMLYSAVITNGTFSHNAALSWDSAKWIYTLHVHQKIIWTLLRSVICLHYTLGSKYIIRRACLFSAGLTSSRWAIFLVACSGKVGTVCRRGLRSQKLFTKQTEDFAGGWRALLSIGKVLAARPEHKVFASISILDSICEPISWIETPTQTHTHHCTTYSIPVLRT